MSMNALESIIRPIVAGQLRSFLADHPGALDKRWLSLVEKRISNDLLSRGSVLRLRAALCAARVHEQPEDASGFTATEASAIGVAGRHCADRSISHHQV